MNLSEAKQILNKNGLILVDKTLNERTEGDAYVYTGLPYKDEYSSIIHAIHGQIYDGIGEGGGRTGAIYRHYFEPLMDVNTKNVNGEFVLTLYHLNSDMIDLLSNCIWRTASIERNDNGDTNNRDIYYDYLRADWKDICKLQGALKKWVKSNNGSNGYENNKPWSDEKRDSYELKKKTAEEKQRQEAEAKKKAEEEQKQKELDAKNEKIKIIETYPTDAKDKKRAEDALRRTTNNYIETYYKLLAQQLNKITDKDKWKRRIAAFYQLAKDHSWRSTESTYDFYMNRMIDRF